MAIYYWNGYEIIGFSEPLNDDENVIIYGTNNTIITEIINDFGAENMTTDELWEYLCNNYDEIY